MLVRTRSDFRASINPARLSVKPQPLNTRATHRRGLRFGKVKNNVANESLLSSIAGIVRVLLPRPIVPQHGRLYQLYVKVPCLLPAPSALQSAEIVKLISYNS